MKKKLDSYLIIRISKSEKEALKKKGVKDISGKIRWFLNQIVLKEHE